MLDQFLAGYAAPEGRFDELLSAPGRPRAHWDAFVRALAERSEREVSDTLSLTERQIREHGITYNVYADSQGAHRPWEVEAIVDERHHPNTGKQYLVRWRGYGPVFDRWLSAAELQGAKDAVRAWDSRPRPTVATESEPIEVARVVDHAGDEYLVAADDDHGPDDYVWVTREEVTNPEVLTANQGNPTVTNKSRPTRPTREQTRPATMRAPRARAPATRPPPPSVPTRKSARVNKGKSRSRQ